MPDAPTTTVSPPDPDQGKSTAGDGGGNSGPLDWVQALRSKAILTIAALVLLLLHANKISIFAAPDTFTIGLLVAAALPWLLALVSRAELPGGWKFDFRDVASKVQHLEKKTDDTQAQVASLYALSMSDACYWQLVALSKGTYGPFYLAEDRTIGLNGELNYLKVLGYLTFDSDQRINGKLIRGVEDIPTGNHENLRLSDYIHVTPQGMEFIALREKTAPKSTYIPTGPPSDALTAALQGRMVSSRGVLPLGDDNIGY